MQAIGLCPQPTLDPAPLALHCMRMEDKVSVSAEDQGDITDLSFEQALGQLEKVVAALEKGDIPLDQSISLYQRGQILRQHCQARLDDAKERIEAIVVNGNGQPTGTRPFDSE
jgi:exodeoxyribonuclease VII small subunit